MAWTLLALTAAMFAVGVAALTADHIDRWTRDTHGSASMVVYLGEGVDEARATALAVELGKLPGIERAQLVPAAQSAARLQQALGADSALLEGVELAGLPASVEVTLAPGVRDVIAMSPTLRALKGSPAVDDIIVEDGGSERIAGTPRRHRPPRARACSGNGCRRRSEWPTRARSPAARRSPRPSGTRRG
jgi:cell division protein FtsX